MLWQLKEFSDATVVREIREAVAAGFPVDHTVLSQDNDTLLCGTVKFNRYEVCRVLLELGADVNFRDYWGLTPFFLACKYRKITCAKLLIDAGARWDIPNNAGVLPLDHLEKNFGKAARAELDEYIARHISQIHSVSAEEEPAYQQEL